ncbi:MAG TPA: type II secretion system protein [Ktedonobacteraceae bacterium]|nr:type II secretion system protein [Ktedonobacteraceae bacterium]
MKLTDIIRNENPQRGYTLLEVIVATSIIAGVMLAILPLVVQSFSVDKQTAYRVKAQALTAQKLDDIVSLSSVSNIDSNGNLVCDWTSSSGVYYSDVTDLETGQPTTPNVVTALTRTWYIQQIHPTPPATPPDLCLVTVTTSFTYQGQTRSFTLVSERGR